MIYYGQIGQLEDHLEIAGVLPGMRIVWQM